MYSNRYLPLWSSQMMQRNVNPDQPFRTQLARARADPQRECILLTISTSRSLRHTSLKQIPVPRTRMTTLQMLQSIISRNQFRSEIQPPIDQKLPAPKGKDIRLVALEKHYTHDCYGSGINHVRRGSRPRINYSLGLFANLDNCVISMDWYASVKAKATVSEHDKLYNMDQINQEIEYVHQNKLHRNDPRFFKKVKISIMALIKMLNHTLMGGDIEVMGLFQGFYNRKGEFYVMDSLALPVEATETRVNAGQEADNFIIQQSTLTSDLGGYINIGWYHSHPNYGCWLSGIDVSTQTNNQMVTDPWLAIVIDPIKTVTREKIEIGAFRTVPSGVVEHKDMLEIGVDIPLKKISQFGVHYNKYYQLQIEFVQNQIDNEVISKLLKQYWITHLAASPFYSNIKFYQQNQEEMKRCGKYICRHQQMVHLSGMGRKETTLKKMVNLTVEKNQALLSEAVKNVLF